MCFVMYPPIRILVGWDTAEPDLLPVVLCKVREGQSLWRSVELVMLKMRSKLVPDTFGFLHFYRLHQPHTCSTVLGYPNIQFKIAPQITRNTA